MSDGKTGRSCPAGNSTVRRRSGTRRVAVGTSASHRNIAETAISISRAMAPYPAHYCNCSMLVSGRGALLSLLVRAPAGHLEFPLPPRLLGAYHSMKVAGARMDRTTMEFGLIG